MTPSLASLVADVYTLTNRPDLVGETLLAVRNATLKAHNTDFYAKDLIETGIKFDFSQAQQAFEYKTVVPRWRALKYLRKYLISTDGTGYPSDFLTPVTPDDLLDNYNKNREDVCYLAGLEIQIRSLQECQYYLLGCYVYPDVTVDNYSSWIADEHPTVILYEATATIFKTIGYDEQNAAYARMLQEEYAMLKQNNIQAVGY